MGRFRGFVSSGLGILGVGFRIKHLRVAVSVVQGFRARWSRVVVPRLGWHSWRVFVIDFGVP